jgi:colicin import membrane protein
MVEALRHYSVPLLLAVALHCAAVLALMRGFNPAAEETRVIKPRIIQSELIVLEPKAQPKPPPPARPKPMQQAPPAPAAQPKPVDKPPPKPVPDPAAERRAAELARERERQKRLDELAKASFNEALQAAAAETAEFQSETPADTDADQQAAQSFRMGIYQSIVANWSRPPSARQGMQAKLLVELVPTGDVVAVSLLESSGNGAFDRSAEAAVHKARRFEVPKDSALFERYFRRFTLLFRPEDLLR